MSARMISDAIEDAIDESLVYGTALPPKRIHDRKTWEQHVYYKQLSMPPKFTPGEFDKLSAQEQHESRALRRKYTAQLGPILSTSYSSLYDEMLRTANTNIEFTSLVKGHVIEGPPDLGKTTLLTTVGRRYELRRRAIHRAQFGSDLYAGGETPWRFTPVVYVSLDGTRTFKALLQAVAAFLLIPEAYGQSELELKPQIAEYANNCGVSLMLIDDLHYLNKDFVGATPLNNELKKWMGIIPATFIYAGIDCENVGLFREWSKKDHNSLSQTNHRFSKLELHPFPRLPKKRDDQLPEKPVPEVADVIKTFDEHCVLLKHNPGDLTKHLSYIMNRTSGYMGAIVTLIKHATALAIMRGDECYSEDLFNKIRLDNASETAYKRRILAGKSSPDKSKTTERRQDKASVDGVASQTEKATSNPVNPQIPQQKIVGKNGKDGKAHTTKSSIPTG